MARGDGAVHETARLLNSQAMNLDAYDVLSIVPPIWSLAVISSFLSRSFRRSLHDLHEGQILKAISSGQNLEVLDEAYTVLREQGAIIEEAGEGDSDDRDQDYDNEKPIIQAVEGEDYALREKVGLHEEEGDEGGITLTRATTPESKSSRHLNPSPQFRHQIGIQVDCSWECG
ncbi:hypothetical protein FRC02_006747 [Tulasnella sp. 418]|nr:hypothetical protein FRC02_006747 [Tulasnella sp. 418]